MKEILIRMTEQQYDELPEMPLVTLHSIIRNGQILPKGETSPCALCQWHKVGEDTYCWECNARPIEEGAEE